MSVFGGAVLTGCDDQSMSPTPASGEEIARAERDLGVRFPSDYLRWLGAVNGAEGWFGGVFVQLYPLAQVVEVTAAAEADTRLPGLVVIGSDGGREMIAFDFRTTPPPVVLVDVAAEGWETGIRQASTFAELLAKRDRGKLFIWN